MYKNLNEYNVISNLVLLKYAHVWKRI